MQRPESGASSQHQPAAADRPETDAALKASYDRQAVKYDENRYVSHSGVYFTDLEGRVIEEWVDGGAARGLDLPCGTGRLTLHLAKRCGEVVAGDISEEMLAQARRKAEAEGVKNVTYRVLNGRSLPYEDGTFDVVICFKFLHLIPNAEKQDFMREFSRVLKPGGKLIVEFNSPFYGGVLAFLRYRGNVRAMTMKCLFPGQGRKLFSGFRVGRAIGVRFPFLAGLSRVFGTKAVSNADLALGRLSLLRYGAYTVMFELISEKSS